MSANTKIEWTDHTFNPWWGCQKVGPGCDHCYAETLDKRTGGQHWGPGAERRRTSVKNWGDPVRWNAKADAFFAEHGRRQRVFCASMADVFDNAVPDEWRQDLANLILNTPNLDWLLLTKRIGNAGEMLGSMFLDGPPENLILGATIVDQKEADRDIPKLIRVSVAKRFLSMEPLLGTVELRKWLDPWTCADCSFHGSDYNCGPDGCNKCGEQQAFESGNVCKSCGADDQAAKPSCPSCGSHRSFERDYGFKFDSERKLIDWVIVGGESGPGARPMHPDWASDLRDQCEKAGVPFLFKQWGDWMPISQMADVEHSALYRSKVKAKPHEDQSVIDDICGKTCTVATTVLHNDGSLHDCTEPMAFLQGTGAMQIFNVGKKAAGRLLDGRTWDGYPS